MTNYKSKSNDYIIKKREILMDYIEKNKTEEFKKKFWDLLEVERELTLREE